MTKISTVITVTCESSSSLPHSNANLQPKMSLQQDKRNRQKRSNKPMMEKRRRARINQSLCQLKNLVTDFLKKDISSGSKLEKADILEMTVSYFQELHQLHVTTKVLNDANVPNKFQAGYLECVHQVGRFLRKSTPVNDLHVQEVMSYIERRADAATAPKGSTQSIFHHSIVSEGHVPMPLQLPGGGEVVVLFRPNNYSSLEQFKSMDTVMDQQVVAQVEVHQRLPDDHQVPKDPDSMWRPW